MKKIITTAGIIVLTLIALAGCKVGGSSAGASASAHVSALATSTSAVYDKTQAEQVLAKCAPAKNNEVAQLKWLKNVVSPAKGKTARHTFESCAGVSKANDAKFQNQVENQGLAVLKVYAHDEAAGNKAAAKTALKNYSENQIEQDAVKDR